MNGSQFVPQASLREAEQVVREETVAMVSPDESAWPSEVTDEAVPAPRLCEAPKRPSAWDA